MKEKRSYDNKRVAVIGGGSSGMMAAITASEQGAFVTIYERNERIGKKILVTGNGKCNFTNSDMRKDCFYSEDMDKAWEILDAFGYADTLAFFEKLGVLYKEKGGYYYPTSEQASVILDALRFKINELGITLRTEEKVTGVVRQAEGICVETQSGKQVYDSVILCTGGSAAPKTGSDGNGYKLAKRMGHRVTLTHPALVQLRAEETYVKQIAGVRADAMISFMDGDKVLCKERGELQLTDYGISGIPVFQCSRVITKLLKGGRICKAHIDFLADYSLEEIDALFEKRYERMKSRTVAEFCNGLLNKKIMQLFMKLCGVKEDALVEKSKEKLQTLFRLCKDFTLTIVDANGYDMAQVTAGGVPLSELTNKLESVKVPGVFFAGELVDVDGKCGGYNLQWAWASGYIAGMQAAKGDGEKS